VPETLTGVAWSQYEGNYIGSKGLNVLVCYSSSTRGKKGEEENLRN